MPPYFAPRGRPPKGYAYADEEEEPQTLLGQNPGPVLPATPVSRSWNYGANYGTALPPRLAMFPHSNLKLGAKNIDAIIERAKKREEQSPPYGQQREPAAQAGKIGRPSGQSTPATRRTKRAPTPDQTQLFDTLREATISPPRDYTQSDSTPSPPVPRTVSTDSSPPADPPTQRRLSMSENPLYPPSMGQPGQHQDISAQNTPTRYSSVDNASEVSWNLERDIHEDNLQRTRPGKYRGEQRGRNITAPPRRPSGLVNMVHETIEEEDEPASEQMSRSRGSDAGGTWTAPARTIIPQDFRSGPETYSPRRASSKQSSVQEWVSSIQPGRRPSSSSSSGFKFKAGQLMCPAAILLLSLIVALVFQLGLIDKIPSFRSKRDPYLHLPPNITEAEIFHDLRSQLSEMHSHMSSMSSELVAVRSEHAHESRPTYPSEPPPYEGKVNFLSPSLGAIVDPRMTTSAAGRRPPYWKRVLGTMVGASYRTGNPASTALTSWEEPGDCWCTSTRNGQSQLSVLLNHDIVPEEVVVEHLPLGESLDPAAAPREIEMWARYRIVSYDETADTSDPQTLYGNPPPPRNSRPCEPRSPRKEKPGGMKTPKGTTLHDVIMDTLRYANMYDPPSAYSDDPILGPSFYRIATMEYNMYRGISKQHFRANAVINVPGIRVDKVVFRVKSNWGSNHTCIYRFKLHGYV